jgi:magnesium-transporting ATPase (P-type)
VNAFRSVQHALPLALLPPLPPYPAGTLTQNDMVVSKLWLAGRLLPDIKPYTRHSQRPGQQQGQQHVSGGSGRESSSDKLRPLADLLAGSSSGTVGAADSDAVQLLIESFALNSTANIYSDSDGTLGAAS